MKRNIVLTIFLVYLVFRSVFVFSTTSNFLKNKDYYPITNFIANFCYQLSIITVIYDRTILNRNMQYLLLLLLPLLNHVTCTCNDTWQETSCCTQCSCLTNFSSQSELYLSHPQLSHYTRGVLFYSGNKELLLSLYIRRDATAADVKCVGMLRFGGF